MSNEELAAGVRVPIASRLRDLIDRYWSLAYAEGREGREHDTEDGAAQQCRGEIEEILRGLDGVRVEGGTRALHDLSRLSEEMGEEL